MIREHGSAIDTLIQHIYIHIISKLYIIIFAYIYIYRVYIYIHLSWYKHISYMIKTYIICYIYLYITYIYIYISFAKIFERWNGSSRDPHDQLLSYSGTAPQPCPSVQGFFFCIGAKCDWCQGLLASVINQSWAWLSTAMLTGSAWTPCQKKKYRMMISGIEGNRMSYPP